MSLSDHVTAIVKKFVEPTRYYGFYPYIVESFAGGRLFVRPVDAKYDVPPLKAVDRIPGFTGADETFPVDSLVLVGFIGGDFARPFVAFTQHVIPTAIAVSVSTGVVSISASPSIATASPVAIASKILAWKTALDIYLTAVQTVIAAINPVQGASLATALTTYGTATNGVGGTYPAGMASRKLSAE